MGLHYLPACCGCCGCCCCCWWCPWGLYLVCAYMLMIVSQCVISNGISCMRHCDVSTPFLGEWRTDGLAPWARYWCLLTALFFRCIVVTAGLLVVFFSSVVPGILILRYLLILLNSTAATCCWLFFYVMSWRWEVSVFLWPIEVINSML